MFLVSLITNILSSQAILGALGPRGGLLVNLIILLALSPPAIGTVIVMDRQICGKEDLNLKKALKIVLGSYFILLGVNLTSWVAIMVGFLLFVIPGIFLLFKLIMINQSFFLGESETIEEVLKESWTTTEGHMFEVFNLVMLVVAPLLLLEVLLYAIPPGFLVALQVTLGTALQTWLVISLSHLFLRVRRSEN